MDFADALIHLKVGARIAREGWNGKGMWLQLIRRDDYRIHRQGGGALLAPDVKLLPWIGMKTVDNGFVPWLASQTDILAEDWTSV